VERINSILTSACFAVIGILAVFSFGLALKSQYDAWHEKFRSGPLMKNEQTNKVLGLKMLGYVLILAGIALFIPPFLGVEEISIGPVSNYSRIVQYGGSFACVFIGILFTSRRAYSTFDFDHVVNPLRDNVIKNVLHTMDVLPETEKEMIAILSHLVNQHVILPQTADFASLELNISIADTEYVYDAKERHLFIDCKTPLNKRVAWYVQDYPLYTRLGDIYIPHILVQQVQSINIYIVLNNTGEAVRYQVDIPVGTDLHNHGPHGGGNYPLSRQESVPSSSVNTLIKQSIPVRFNHYIEWASQLEKQWHYR
jgi:hypothetical protein